MTDISKAGVFPLGDRSVKRMGYGAMQLAGPGVWGPPKDRAGAQAVLRAAVEAGVDHIDTADIYGPHVTNEIIAETLHPYPADLTLVTKIGAERGPDASWNESSGEEALIAQVHDNLRRLRLDRLEVVNFRRLTAAPGLQEGSIERPMTVMAELQRQGLVGHIGLSTVTSAQVAEARAIAPVVCVQNLYNLAMRGDDALIDELAAAGIAYVPYFPLRRPTGAHGEFAPVESPELSAVAHELGATPMQVALAWLLHRSPNIVVIPGTSSIAHLQENLAAAELSLPADALARLDSIGTATA